MTLIYRTRKLIKAGDLNGRNTLFGGRVMEWIDEECAVYATCQMGTPNILTKYISEMNFMAPAYQGDIIEIGVANVDVGRTSLTLQCSVRDKDTKREILSVDKIVFVSVDREGRPTPHDLSDSANDGPTPALSDESHSKAAVMV